MVHDEIQVTIQRKSKRRKNFDTFINQKYLHLMTFPFIIWICIFSFAPMYGYIMAFTDYNLNLGILGSPFVGLKHFILFFQNPMALQVVRNTMVIATLRIIAMNIFPLIFALLINELRAGIFKRATQTISYLPHFVSMAVVGNIFFTMLSLNGPINTLLLNMGLIKESIGFLWNRDQYWIMATGITVWKEIGWGAIIYLAAICGIDEELYEAARVDGCKKMGRIIYITIPCILPTVVILLVRAVSGIFSASFEMAYIFGNAANREMSEVISSFVFKQGLRQGRYSYATAIELMQTIIGFGLVALTNKISRYLTGYSLW